MREAERRATPSTGSGRHREAARRATPSKSPGWHREVARRANPSLLCDAARRALAALRRTPLGHTEIIRGRREAARRASEWLPGMKRQPLRRR